MTVRQFSCPEKENDFDCKNISSCRVMSSKGEDYPFIFTTNLPRYVMKPRHCLYPMTHFIHEGSEYFSLRCKNVPSNCIAWCTAYERRTLFLSRGMPLGKAFTSPLAAAAAQRGSDGPRRETTSISNKTAVASLPKSMNLHTSDTDVPIFGPGDDEEKAAEGEEEGNPGAEEVLGEEEEEEEVYVPGTQSPEIVENGMAEEPSCEDVKGNPLWTFWLYLFIRTFAELFPAAVVALLDAAVLRLSSVPDLNSSSISSSTAISNSRAHFGSQHVWGLVAMSLFSPLCGYLMDIHSGAFNFVDFAACFYALAALMIITAVLAAVLPFGAEPFCRSWWKDMGRVLGNIELVAMFCVCLALGVYWGGLETFLYWYLEDLGAPRVLLGATIAAGAVPAIPVFCAIQPIIRVCGHANLLIIALTVYSARLAGYSAITNPWVSLPWEALEVFTLHLAWAAALMYAYEKSPRSLTATTQALVTIIHFGVGRGLGSLLGGYGISVFGARNTLRMASVSAAVLAVVYLAFYHLFLRVHRCRREKDFDRRMRMEREEMMKPMAQGGSYPPVILTTPGPKTWRNGVT
ncbi:unnamed protein product [Notodromas monacha]|uniref:Major facilitator superfamily associated domain-containing protein n=1 Tax=Notodromas monacha TaxID=399045 RepID=A0A7R9GFJ2_9CRUS|nr:unnamed protein product [Notodromas monacha]CAG0920743.1 unnamed protein product [Notodromas monacha]